MFKSIISFFLALIYALFGLNGYKKADNGDFYERIIDEQSEYVLGLIQCDGSLIMAQPVYNGEYAGLELPSINGIESSEYTSWKSAKVCPYFSCIAMCGLLEAAPEKAQSAAQLYISRHIESLNTAQTDVNGVDGTIYDTICFVSEDKQRVVNVPAQLFGSPAYDSTDSYAALFLKLLYTYAKAYPDSDFLDSYVSQAQRVVSAMLATYVDELGLSYAKPDYQICYLMDNCEVYEGLVCASKLFGEVYGDSEKAAQLGATAENVKNAIEREMYVSYAGAYYSSVATDGKATSSVDAQAMANFYPEGTSQLFLITCGLLDKDSIRAKYIYERFNINFEYWTTLGVGSGFPWAVIAKAAAIMGDGERVEKYFKTLDEAYFSVGCPYPYYCAEAGQVLSAAEIIR